MVSDAAIQVEELGKRYRLGAAAGFDGSLRDAMTGLARRLTGRGAVAESPRDFWALREVSFQVERGQVIGVVGRNGAGKSTLLKILSRITAPTRGSVELDGRVGSLLEVGTGFHPELSGRENIYLNGTILGMRKREIDDRFDAIVAFSGIEAFLDTPVKRYSSGMTVRLAFAVAAHLDPEILIVDEVLAVGDVAFQKKCMSRIRQVASQEGCTILFVSHNLAAIQGLCDRCLMLRDGRLVMEGSPEKVAGEYLRLGGETDGRARFEQATDRKGNGAARYRAIRLLDDQGHTAATIPMGKGFSVELDFDLAGAPIADPNFGVTVQSRSGQPIFRLTTHETLGVIDPVRQGGKVRLDIPALNLMHGTYCLGVHLHDGTTELDRIDEAIALEVSPWAVYPTGKVPPARAGLVMFAPDCRWRFDYGR
jgi:lipopolysaccharide transport system ATP-binding protein